ncbi:MAG: hypothetical protein U5L06_16465 [Rhodovibrio sp.]|nr:hypothetical protein [Rhodovibrio sp.]
MKCACQTSRTVANTITSAISSRRRARLDERQEVQLAAARDQDVLRVADRRRRRARVARGRQRDQKRPGIPPLSGEAGAQHRRHREHHDVVGEHGGQPAGGDHHARQQDRRTPAQRDDPARAGVVGPGGAELRGDDHHREQHDQGVAVDRPQRLTLRQGARCHHGDRAHDRDAGAVDPQARQPAERHPEVGDGEDGGDEDGHARALSAVGTGRRLIGQGARRDQATRFPRSWSRAGLVFACGITGRCVGHRAPPPNAPP